MSFKMFRGGIHVEQVGRRQYVLLGVSSSGLFLSNSRAVSAVRKTRTSRKGIGCRQQRGGKSVSSSNDRRKSWSKQFLQ